MGAHFFSVFPLLLEPTPKPHTQERPVLLPGLWLENTNFEFGKVAMKRPPDTTVREMRDVIVLDIPAYVRGLRERLKEEGVEVAAATRQKDLEGEDLGWWLEHPLETEVEDDDIRKLVMMSCILAGARTFGIDRPVMAQFKTPGDSSTLEYVRYDSHRHIWLRPRNPDPANEEDLLRFHGLEFDLEAAQQYCQKLEPYFRAKSWHSGRVAVALGAFLSYVLARPDGQGYLSLMTVFEALLSTDKSEITHQISERTAFMLETGEQGRYDLYRTMKRLYGTRSRLIHGDIDNKRGEITYDKLRLDAKMTIVPDQDYFDIFDICRRLFRAVLQKPELVALLEKKKSTEQLNEYYLRMGFRS
jgi:hypothetical protein